MDKTSLLAFLGEIEGFQPVDPTKAHARLDADFIRNLWDAAVKWGQPTGRGVVFKQGSLFIEVYDYRGNGMGGIAGMFIANGGNRLAGHRTKMFELRNGIWVTWDGELSVDEAKARLREADARAKSKGWIQNQIRMDLNRPHAAQVVITISEN